MNKVKEFLSTADNSQLMRVESVELFKTNFLNKTISDALQQRTKINSFLTDFRENYVLTNGNLSEAEVLFAQWLETVSEEMKPIYAILDSYTFLIKQVLTNFERHRPKFLDLFFRQDISVRSIIFELYPQSMEVSHYKEIFDICGYGSNLESEKITQMTMKRFQAYTNFQAVNREHEVQESYLLSELSGVIREAKIQQIVENFWNENSRLQSLESLAEAKGGSLVWNGEKVKVFEIRSDAEKNALVYATPALYVYDSESLLENQKGAYFFLNEEPKMATILFEINYLLLRQDFLKPPASSEFKFPVKITIPINLFRFFVKKDQ